jgi:cell division septum initiation protein DivIVA
MTETAPTGPTFRQAKNGYERDDVDAHVQELNQRLVDTSDRADTERQRAEEAERAAETARTALRELERRTELPGYDVLAQRLRAILEAADEAATELRTRTEIDAKICKQQAEDRAAEIVGEARASAAGIIEGGREEAAKLTSDAGTLKQQAEDRAAEILAEARAEADQTTRRGRQEAATAVADADRRVRSLRDDLAQLESQRDRTLEALGSLRDQLTRAAQDLLPAGDDRATQDGHAA